MDAAAALQIQDAPSIVISDHADVMQILKDKKMAVLQAESGHGGQFSAQVIHDGVIELWGDVHIGRRQILGPIFNLQRLTEIEAEAIRPGVLDPLIELGRKHPGVAAPQIDLLKLFRRAVIRLTGALAGLSGLDSDEEIDRFDADFRIMERGIRAKFIDPKLAAPLTVEAVEARDRLIARHAAPVWKEREPVAERIRRGELPVSALPTDLITTMLLKSEHYDSFGQAKTGARAKIGELAIFMVASVGSTPNAMCAAVHELLNWLNEHPEDRGKTADPEFLDRCLRESIRLHQANRLLRTAMHDVVLPSGTKVDKGTVVIVDRVAFNRAAEAQGCSHVGIGKFDPYRTMPKGVAQYALGFGGGVHTCVGRPIILGEPPAPGKERTRLGFSINMLLCLLKAGVDLIPGKNPTFDEKYVGRETFVTFPVQFRSLEALGALND